MPPHDHTVQSCCDFCPPFLALSFRAYPAEVCAMPRPRTMDQGDSVAEADGTLLYYPPSTNFAFNKPLEERRFALGSERYLSFEFLGV